MKTTWQKVYSFFGFWTYTVHSVDGSCRRVLYWCFFPFLLPFIRKFDIFSWDVTETDGIEALRARHRELLQSIGEED